MTRRKLFGILDSRNIPISHCSGPQKYFLTFCSYIALIQQSTRQTKTHPKTDMPKDKVGEEVKS